MLPLCLHLNLKDIFCTRFLVCIVVDSNVDVALNFATFVHFILHADKSSSSSSFELFG